MGWHRCPFCPGEVESHVYFPTSSGDITLVFPNNNRYKFPDMILHFAIDEGYRPPQVFINDVMMFEPNQVSKQRRQTRSLHQPVDLVIAYLESDDFERGEVPEGFHKRLAALVEAAAAQEGYPLNVLPKSAHKQNGVR